jgi:hypothetical protein
MGEGRTRREPQRGGREDTSYQHPNHQRGRLELEDPGPLIYIYLLLLYSTCEGASARQQDRGRQEKERAESHAI